MRGQRQWETSCHRQAQATAVAHTCLAQDEDTWSFPLIAIHVGGVYLVWGETPRSRRHAIVKQPLLNNVERRGVDGHVRLEGLHLFFLPVKGAMLFGYIDSLACEHLCMVVMLDISFRARKMKASYQNVTSLFT